VKPLFVLCCVGLTPDHLGGDTPRLSALAEHGFTVPLTGVVPAVTATAQASMLTGTGPAGHGIVANGWYFRELGEVWLWRQSERLLQVPCLWDQRRQAGRPLTVLKHFWWFAMNSTADGLVTPRPAYHADGRKSADCYTRPTDLKDRLSAAHGRFPLFSFWGPTAGIAATRWIADAFVTATRATGCDLGLCYLPHLDYDLQRYGPTGAHLAGNLQALDACVGTILDHAAEQDARVLVVSEYGIEAVDTAIAINRLLRTAGLLAVTTNATGELLDPGASRAFAVCDHQLAHIYCADADARDRAAALLTSQPGVAAVLAGTDRRRFDLDHPRSGELVALAAPGCWFTYDYWLDDDRRPDFARCVEIHRKPGYDPRELLFDPHGGRWRAARALARKFLGLRYVMDPIPLDTALVRGSHGRPTARSGAGPLLIGSDPSWRPTTPLAMTGMAALMDRILDT
jgi:predicted AlkP superfamily pyrophosphatase or phosphodiesterase